MINLADYEIHDNPSSPNQDDILQNTLNHLAPINNNQVHIQENAIIYQIRIQEIDNHYQSIQHSSNLLDQIQREENDSFEDKICNEKIESINNSEGLKFKMRQERRRRNETKNIPKNFGKGIISFIQKNQKNARQFLSFQKLSLSDFMAKIRKDKQQIHTIADLRRLWTDPIYGKCLRIMSNYFFRRQSLHYIFNSRITNYSSHIRYRQSLWKALKNPQEFYRMKQY